MPFSVMTKEQKELISNSILFDQAAEQTIEALVLQVNKENDPSDSQAEAPGVYIRTYGKRETVFSPKEYRRELGILLSGRLKVTKGSSELVVSELGPGDLLGAAALFTKEEGYVSSIRAVTEAKILFLTQATVERLIDEDSHFRKNYVTYLSERIRFLSGKVETLSIDSGIKKLASFFLKQMNDEGKVVLTFSMTELAKRLDTSRAALYRDLDQLEEEELIRREGKTVQVLDADRLKRM